MLYALYYVGQDRKPAAVGLCNTLPDAEQAARSHAELAAGPDMEWQPLKDGFIFLDPSVGPLTKAGGNARRGAYRARKGTFERIYVIQEVPVA
jgi:hypothetical protein